MSAWSGPEDWWGIFWNACVEFCLVAIEETRELLKLLVASIKESEEYKKSRDKLEELLAIHYGWWMVSQITGKLYGREQPSEL